jgi:hypothetical protein
VLHKTANGWGVAVDKVPILEATMSISQAAACQICLHYIMNIEYAAPKSFAMLEYILGLRGKAGLPRVVKNLIHKYRI